MSGHQQPYDYPPPPPGPAPAVVVSGGVHVSSAAAAAAAAAAAGGTSPGHARARLPPGLSTNLGNLRLAAPLSASTPTSAVASPQSSLSPNTPATSYPRSTPNSAALARSPSGLGTASPLAMEPYDPRQWSGRGTGSSSSTHAMQGTQMPVVPSNMRSVSGNEHVMPSPPPPYSPQATEAPPRGVRAVAALETAAALNSTSSQRTDSPAVAISSPMPPMSPGFPPPPPPSSSRHRDRSLTNQLRSFGLSNLRNKQPVRPEPQQSQPAQLSQVFDVRPPASRRAASTGQMQESSMVTRLPHRAEQTSQEHRWQPGMPLPGPPPGPPPSEMRSQSLNRIPSSSQATSSERGATLSEQGSTAAPSNQRRGTAAPSLGPIPPTPADWLDSDHPPPGESEPPVPDLPQSVELADPDYQPLRIDTGSRRDEVGGRRPRRLEDDAPNLRERRSKSRAARDGRSDSSNGRSDDSRPKDLVASTAEGSIKRRREHARNTSVYQEPASAPAAIASIPLKPSSSQQDARNATIAMTPPYTPAVAKGAIDESLKRRSAIRLAPGSASSDRPISHLLHSQNLEEASMPTPLSPAPASSRQHSVSSTRAAAKLDTFYLKALDRHRMFIEKEANASSEEERLELFANFLVHESRLRRDRYSTAYNAMAGEIVDLTRDMWRSYTRSGRRAETPSTSMSSADPTFPSWASDGQPNSAQGYVPSSASSLGEFGPATDATSNPDLAESIKRSESRQWADGFKPSLSPIPSMAVSTANDESSSRGRKSSRWWEENSQSGSGSIGNPGRIEKSRRETKYMGVSVTALQENDQTSQSTPEQSRFTPTPGASGVAYGANEYPPEKVGWHEDNLHETPVATPGLSRARQGSDPAANPLNVSRLVTLPPPYPRHHPAVNNSHPLLADLRNQHRALADQSKVQMIKDAFLDHEFTMQKEQQEAARERRKQSRRDIQNRVTNNIISFAEAAQAESAFDAEEADRAKTDVRAHFDLFETHMAQPLNELLEARLEKTKACIEQLRIELESGDEAPDPNQAQEEGDEQPERLEKLTLLKWLFETREQLHKEMFDLHSDRSAKYSEVILTPFRTAKLRGKMDEANAFFARDARNRNLAYAADTLRRYEDLRALMEANVSRGVEDQLSAFWDIAPGLLEVIQPILPAAPSSASAGGGGGGGMAGLDVLIPPQELDENPAYADHPLQYLYSLLAHADRSAYQFIESQINLLCLLHEVRTAAANAAARKREVEKSSGPAGAAAGAVAGAGAGADYAALVAQTKREQLASEERLTGDLKEKVGEVERQWSLALGETLRDCKARVREWLVQTGGWEEGLE